MKKSDYLYILIAAMTTSERRYFSVQSGKNTAGSNAYRRLFDAVVEHPNWRDNEITKRYSFKNFNYLKSYLYKRLVKYLCDYHQVGTENVMISNVPKLLLWKGLYEMADNWNKNIKKQAYLIEDFPGVISAIETERIVLDHQRVSINLKDRYDQIRSEYQSVLGKVEELSELRRLWEELHQLVYFSDNSRSKEVLNEVDGIVERCDLKFNTVMSTKAELVKHRIKAIGAFHLMDYPDAEKYFKICIDQLDKLNSVHTDPVYFCHFLNDLASVYVRLSEESKFDSISNEIEKIIDQMPLQEQKEKFLLNLYISKINFWLLQRRFDRLQEIIDLIPEDLSKVHDKNSLWRNVLEYNRASACFYFGDCKRSLRYLNNVLNIQQKGKMSVVFYSARIVNLLIHFELGNDQLLDDLINAYKKQQSRLPFFSKFTKGLVYLLEGLLYNPDRDEKINLLEEFLSRYNDTSGAGFESGSKSVFYFDFWVTNSLKELKK